MKNFVIRDLESMKTAVGESGMLPFFKNRVPGWSVEERIDPMIWFTNRDGPWEWKGPLASSGACVYGKFLRGKAAFVSPECFPDLANFRREGLVWEEWEEEGRAAQADRRIMRFLETHPLSVSSQIRRGTGLVKGYDAALTRLQMQTFVVIADFRYSVSKDGVPYGWGNAVPEPAERFLPEDVLFPPAGRTPEASFERLIRRLLQALPHADEAALRRELA